MKRKRALSDGADIVLEGVRTHHLKNITVRLPRSALVVITGVSGSGKSSLAFHTLYAEAAQRYMHGLSSFARQVLSHGEGQPVLDQATGLSPAMAIQQKTMAPHPRATVGSVTGVMDYLRLLWSRCGLPVCPVHPSSYLQGQTREEIIEDIQQYYWEERIAILSPFPAEAVSGWSAFADYLNWLQQKGFVRIWLANQVLLMADREEVQRLYQCCAPSVVAYIVIDRCRLTHEHMRRVIESLDTALALSAGRVMMGTLSPPRWRLYQTCPACTVCGYTLPEMSVAHLSTHHPLGACSVCQGLGWVSTVSKGSLKVDHAVSLAQGALCWQVSDQLYDLPSDWLAAIRVLSEVYAVDVTQPYAVWPLFFQCLVWQGTGTMHRSPYQVRVEGAPDFQGLLHMGTDGLEAKAMRCPSCVGSGLQRPAQLAVYEGYTLPAAAALSIEAVMQFLEGCQTRYLASKASPSGLSVIEETATRIIERVLSLLRFLVDVGLSYLSLDRPIRTLSQGEGQRIRLASQLGLDLSGILYVLDEPSLGLHPRDIDRLLGSLRLLQTQGNSLVVVAHDPAIIRAADYLIEMGPGPGAAGGQVVNEGSFAVFMRDASSPTVQYLCADGRPELSTRQAPREWLHLSGISCHHIEDLSFSLPWGVMTAVTGVSGSGKSTLIESVLYPFAQHYLKYHVPLPTVCMSGDWCCEEVLLSTQAGLGRSARSTIATYTGVFAMIRTFFASLPLAAQRGYTAAHFSFNVTGGRCEACQGEGHVKVDMMLMPSFWAPCRTCGATRYRNDILEVCYQGHHIADVLALSISQARDLFAHHYKIERRLALLEQLGLGYMTLGHALSDLSGGEAQRLQLAVDLVRSSTARRLYLLDEPTRGLHGQDVGVLMRFLWDLRAAGHTIVLIEHNLSVISAADWVIDMGPESGAAGGRIVAAGTPEVIAGVAESYTGQALQAYWAQSCSSS